MVTGLTNGTLYGFKVRAVSPRGDGAESNEAEVVPGGSRRAGQSQGDPGRQPGGKCSTKRLAAATASGSRSPPMPPP